MIGILETENDNAPPLQSSLLNGLHNDWGHFTDPSLPGGDRGPAGCPRMCSAGVAAGQGGLSTRPLSGFSPDVWARETWLSTHTKA